MSVFISDMFIKSYRGINSLELRDLAHVNIITGDNNSGKTSVLELLKSVENPGDFNVWRTSIRRDNYSIRRGLIYFEGFYDLFDVDSDNKNEKIKLDGKNINICNLIKSVSKLDIIGCGRCSRIPSGLVYILQLD